MAAYEVLLGKTSSYDELDELVKQIGSWQDFKKRNPLCCLAVLFCCTQNIALKVECCDTIMTVLQANPNHVLSTELSAALVEITRFLWRMIAEYLSNDFNLVL